MVRFPREVRPRTPKSNRVSYRGRLGKLTDKPKVSIKAFVRAMDVAGLTEGRRWLNEDDRAGHEGRKHPGGDSLGVLYNRLLSIDALALYCRYFGVEDTEINQAKEYAGKRPLSTKAMHTLS